MNGRSLFDLINELQGLCSDFDPMTDCINYKPASLLDHEYLDSLFWHYMELLSAENTGKKTSL
jgi:hypothetical protein